MKRNISKTKENINPVKKTEELMSLECVCVFMCVCACVWLVPVATVWLYQWERLFESLCGLFLMLTSQCLVACVVWTRGYMGTVCVCVCTFVCICGCLSALMCACSMLWDWVQIPAVVYLIHVAVSSVCSTVGLPGSCVSIPVDVKQLNSTSLLGS